MLPSHAVVELSRWQFGITALFHFLFVPLTLGLSWLLVIMEAVYVMTGKEIYKHMTKFWGKLFGINVAMAVITGITLEFQFGQNWAYYSRFNGDVFGVPLAVEGITAFMLEGAFFGLFFFGWKRLSKVQHLMVTFFLAVGASLSALVILVANGWMQHPVGAIFNYQTMKMQLLSWNQLWLNPDAQVRFVHTLSAGYVTGAIFVLGVSSFYLLHGRDIAFAKRSFAVATGFGMASVLSVLLLGDATGLTVDHLQKAKMAAIEAEWDTQPPPASWTLFAIPSQKKETNYFSIKIPWALGIIATHSLSGTVEGVNQIISENQRRIRNGMLAYGLLQKIRNGNQSPATLAEFRKHEKDLGYGLLLKRYTPTVTNATEAQIQQAAKDTIPNVLVIFWSFRIMLFAGLFMLLIFLTAIYYGLKGTIWQKRWLLRTYVYSIPLPWLAAEAGWMVAEHGRQPWIVYQQMPTFLGASTEPLSNLILSLSGFVLFFTGLFVVELYLMFKYSRLGPSSLHTGQYHFEKLSKTSQGH